LHYLVLFSTASCIHQIFGFAFGSLVENKFRMWPGCDMSACDGCEERLVFEGENGISVMMDVGDSLVGAATEDLGPKLVTVRPEVVSIQMSDFQKLLKSADVAEAGSGCACFVEICEASNDKMKIVGTSGGRLLKGRMG
jgi:hypothetical protein